MSLKALMRGPLPVTAPLVLNPLMAKMAEAAGFPAGYLGGGATGYQKVALEANLNLTEMCHAAIDIRAVSSLPLILDAACGYGDPMHVHRTIGMSEAAGFAAIEIEDQLVPKRAHHHIGIEHMIPSELMAAKVKEAVAARRARDFVIIARTNAMRASTWTTRSAVAKPTGTPAPTSCCSRWRTRRSSCAPSPSGSVGPWCPSRGAAGSPGRAERSGPSATSRPTSAPLRPRPCWRPTRPGKKTTQTSAPAST